MLQLSELICRYKGMDDWLQYVYISARGYIEIKVAHTI